MNFHHCYIKIHDKFKYDIKTFDSWDLFKNDVGRTTAFGYLKEWPKSKVYEFLQSEVNKKALEPVLKNHRFVKVVIKYDRSARVNNDELNSSRTKLLGEKRYIPL